jgi:hypothetical protein
LKKGIPGGVKTGFPFSLFNCCPKYSGNEYYPIAHIIDKFQTNRIYRIEIT